MVTGKNFVCLGNNMWDGNFSNSLVEIMTVLSLKNRVLYVDYEYTFKDMWETIKGNKQTPLKRMLGLQPRLRELVTRYNSRVYVLTPPPVFPLNKIKSHSLFLKMLSLNAGIVESKIKEACDFLNFNDPILVSGFNPYYGTMLTDKLKESLNIYYCYDEIDAGWHKLHGPLVEEDYMKKADVVITSSDYLYNKKSSKTASCHLIKNGVDFHAFSKFSDMVKSENSSKVIGYTGSIDIRFDIETVSYLISNLPQHEFLFAGRVTNKNALTELTKFGNVKLLGSKRPEEIPAIVGGIDLGIVPYIKNPLTMGVSPIKFNEYLAAGKPVVSTDFANLPEFNGLIRFASSKEEFLQAVIEELSNDTLSVKMRRTDFASNNSWISRAGEFSLLVEEGLKKKKSKIVYGSNIG